MAMPEMVRMPDTKDWLEDFSFNIVFVLKSKSPLSPFWCMCIYILTYCWLRATSLIIMCYSLSP